jgi:prolyl 4-hydroxylase
MMMLRVRSTLTLTLLLALLAVWVRHGGCQEEDKGWAAVDEGELSDLLDSIHKQSVPVLQEDVVLDDGEDNEDPSSSSTQSCSSSEDGTPSSEDGCAAPEDDDTDENDKSFDPDFDGYVENSWGEPQQVTGAEGLKTQRVLQKIYTYMTEQVMVDDEKFAAVRKECKLRDKLCAFWAAIGECEKNPAYMTTYCAPACGTCEQVSYETRCPYDTDAPGVWEDKGLVEALFTSITTDAKYAPYAPVILSQDPWVVQLDNFTTAEECQTLIDLGATLGYQRSEDVGETKFDGSVQGVQSEGRTSTNAWCSEACETDPVTQRVMERIQDLIGIPQANYEFLQLLRYEEGQFYNSHHDYIGLDRKRPQGVRILTVFLYLNDVEEGGGTNFPKLKNKELEVDDLKGITVQPKVGRVVIWPSVLDVDPHRKDHRTEHQALPVLKGIKYGANAWVHQKDFKEPYSKNCV